MPPNALNSSKLNPRRRKSGSWKENEGPARYRSDRGTADPGWRDFLSKRIKCALLVKRIQDYALAKPSDPGFEDIKLSREQIRCAEILLSKILPSVANVQVQVDERKVFVIAAPPIEEDTDRWMKTIEGKVEGPSFLLEQLKNVTPA